MTSRRTAARRVVAMLIVVASLLVACSDGEPRLRASEYRTRASAHCQTLKDASTELRKAQVPSATGTTVERYVHRAAERLRDLVHSLDALEPPRALERDADELVDLLDGYADGLDRLSTRVGPDDTLIETFEKNPRLVERLNRDAREATALVTRLELSGCLLS